MPRRTTVTSRRAASLAGTLGLLVTAALLPAVPASAALPDGVPAGYWPSSCADDITQYCVESVSVLPADADEATESVPGLDAWASVAPDPDDELTSVLTWAVDGWSGQSEEIRTGEVTMVIRTGQFVPRFTAATAQGLHVSRDTDDEGNNRLTLRGRPAPVSWNLGTEYAELCTAANYCGEYDDLASVADSGWKFQGHTQDLGSASEDYMAAIDGAYVASGAQGSPRYLGYYEDNPEDGQYLWLGGIGGPQLDLAGNPVRGAMNVWIPGAYFENTLLTTATDALETGFDLVSSGEDAPTSVPLSAYELDGGVALDVPDLAYPTAISQLNIFHRPSGAAEGDGAPGSPEQVTATGAMDSVDVTWAAPESDGGSPITGYRARAFSAATGGTVLSRCDSETAESTSCNIWSLTDGDTVYVSVNAITALGEGPAQPRIAAVVGEQVDLPSVPRALKVVAGVKRLDASWTAPYSDGGGFISRYTARAYAAASGGAPVATCVALEPKLTCAFTGLTSTAKLYVSVSATNEAGMGPYVATRVAAAPLLPASTPRTVKAVSAKGTIKVTWAAPLSTGNTPITSYQASLFTASSGGSAAVKCTTNGSGLGCTSPALKVGKTYYVSVFAFNKAGVSGGSARIKVLVKK
jgi:hypothetical protein